MLDGKIIVGNRHAFSHARRAMLAEGIFGGISSGAVLHAALRAASRIEREQKVPVSARVVGGAIASNGGTWMATSDGNVLGIGTSTHGSLVGERVEQPIAGIAASADGGYWLTDVRGHVFGFDARVYGSLDATQLNAPVVGIAPAPGGGYWLAAADGGVFAFGAPSYGSLASAQLNAPVVGIAASPNGGYWLAGADGGVFAFNASQTTGLSVAAGDNQVVVGTRSTPDLTRALPLSSVS